MFDTRRLEVLVAVADHGSVSAAALALSLTQPSVSHHLARLEAQAGVALVERGPRGSRPTAAGEVLVEHGRAVLDRLARAEHDLADVVALRAGHVAIRAFPTAFIDLVPRAIDGLQRRTPAVHATFSPGSHDSAIEAVLGRDADVAVVFTDPQRSGATLPGVLRRTHLMDDPMLAVLPRGHRLANRSQISLKQLATEPWVVGTTRGPDSIIRRACAAAGIQPNIVIETDDLLVVQGVVAAGLAVSLTPALAVAHTRPDIVLRPLADKQLFRRIEAIDDTTDPTPATKALIDELKLAADDLSGG
jgi:DNA-binding transcriptional LysR family regulator